MDELHSLYGDVHPNEPTPKIHPERRSVKIKSRITKRAITTAFLDLLSKKPFEKITVRDIVEKCALTRNTFYYYFADTYDIVDDVLTTAVDRILKEGRGNTWQAYVTAIARFTQNDRRRAVHLIKSSKQDEIFVYINKAAERLIRQCITDLEGDHPISPEDRDIIVDTVRSAVVSTTREWLLRKDGYPITDSLTRLGVLFGNAVQAAVKTAQN